MNHPVFMPEMGENIDQGFVTRIEVAVGDRVDVGQMLIEVESDKVVLEVPAEDAGIIQELLVNEGDKIEPGQRFANISVQDFVDESIQPETIQDPDYPLPEKDIETIDKPAETSKPGAASAIPPIRLTSIIAAAYAGPSAQRLARELGTSINRIAGSAEGGRVSCADIKAFVQTQGTASQKQFDLLPDFSEVTAIERQPLGGIARATARNMTNSWERIPHAWLQIKVDITQLEEIREKQKTQIDENQKLSLTVFLLKALAQTLQQFPKFNACFDELAEELVIKKEIHLGLAVDTPRGLLVPVLQNVNQLSLLQLAEQLQRLTEAGRQNQFSAEQLWGAGMSLSSLGGMGIDSLFPIINWPEIAILGAGTATIEPVWQQDQFIPRTMLNLVLGFDHRVINGADGALFLNHLKELLEKPFLLALS
ncbi:MAG: dihydrolipoamide acetyltransferase family protein [Desulfuromusa sp.]|nr:dihydrolipoamide acetyltransferase family protein [Desulfuromusa sp.]